MSCNPIDASTSSPVRPRVTRKANANAKAKGVPPRAACATTSASAALPAPRSASVALLAKLEPRLSYRVRAAVPADAGAMLPLWRDMMRAHERYDRSFALSDDAERTWQRATVELMHRHDSFVVVAAMHAQVAGFCSGWVGHNPPVYEARTVGLVSELVVAAAHRQRGIGSALLAAARAWFCARELPEFQLSVAVHNEAGRAFWRQQGGEPVLERYRFALQ